MTHKGWWKKQKLSLFISFLYLDLYVLGDDIMISFEYFMRTKQLCVLINIRIKGKIGIIKHA